MAVELDREDCGSAGTYRVAGSGWMDGKFHRGG